MTTPDGYYNAAFNPNGKDTNSTLTIVSSICTGITAVVVSGRLYTRAVVKRSLRAEDYVSGAALIFVIASTVVACVADQRAGIGLDFYSATIPDFVMWFKLLWVYNFLYPFTISLVRVSILLSIRRIALGSSQSLLHKACTILLGITPLYLLAMMLIQLLQCKPISAWWDPYSHVGQCGGNSRIHAEYSIVAFFSPIADLILLGLGILAVGGRRRINELRRRIGLGVIAVLTIGAIAITFFRFGIWEIVNNHSSTMQDVWDAIIYTFWLPPQLEATFLLTAASIPAMEPLLGKRGKRNSFDAPSSMRSMPETGFGSNAASMEMLHPGKAQHSVIVTAAGPDNASEQTAVLHSDSV